MMRFGCGAHIMGHGHGQHGTRGKDAPRKSDQPRWVPPETDVDPVCGKTVRTDEAKSAVHEGTVYYFCSPEHREVFEARSEEHTSELQSLMRISYAVFCLKTKKTQENDSKRTRANT